jgi:hypothetical protein
MVLTIEARLHDYKNSSFGDALELTLYLESGHASPLLPFGETRLPFQ